MFIHLRSPTSTYMQNYLELLDKLLMTEIQIDNKTNNKHNRDNEDKEEKILCGSEGNLFYPLFH